MLHVTPQIAFELLFCPFSCDMFLIKKHPSSNGHNFHLLIPTLQPRKIVESAFCDVTSLCIWRYCD